MHDTEVIFCICLLAIPALAFCPANAVFPVPGENISFFSAEIPHSAAPVPYSEFLSRLSRPPDGIFPGKPLNVSSPYPQGLIPDIVTPPTAENGAPLSVFSPDAQQQMENVREAIRKYKTAPENAEFREILSRLKSRNSSADQESKGSDDASLGLIPSPIDIIFLSAGESPEAWTGSVMGDDSRDIPLAGSALTSSPRTFDLRSTGRLTPVREQGQCGACWAFSTYGSLESTNLPGSRWDFSENNMKNAHGFDLSPCQGGNYLMAAAYLARWSGPVDESADPYRETGASTVQNIRPLQHVQEIVFLPSRQGPLDNTLIKEAIRQHGAVYSSIRWEKPNYNPARYSYYYSGSSIQNHAIDIVGWDDTYSRYNFAATPPGDGAFIVRNSWGDDWGDQGYFYVSYYDTVIGRELIQFFSEPATNYDQVYAYDPLGWVTSVGAGSDTIHAANVFTATGNEELRAVSFYTPIKGSSYEVEVSLNPTTGPRGTTSLPVASGTLAYAGYHTIKLDRPVILGKGQKFSVILRLTTPGNGYPLAVEYPMAGYSSRAGAHAGESFISTDGTSWTDLTQVVKNGNACIKAFTITRGTVTPSATPTPAPTRTPQPIFSPFSPLSSDTKSPAVQILSPGLMASFSPGDTIEVKWSARDSGGISSVKIEYSTDNGASWTLLSSSSSDTGSCSWKVPEGYSGKVTFRVTAVDRAGNSGYASRSVTISSVVKKTPTMPAGKPKTFSPLLENETRRISIDTSAPLQVPESVMAQSDSPSKNNRPILPGNILPMEYPDRNITVPPVMDPITPYTAVIKTPALQANDMIKDTKANRLTGYPAPGFF